MKTLHGHTFFPNQQFPFIERYTIPKGRTVPLHRHDFVELVYVVSGNAMHKMGKQTWSLSAGDVFVLEPDKSQSFTFMKHEETVVYNVLFNVDLLSKDYMELQQMTSSVNFFYLAPFLRKSSAFIPYNPLKEYQRLSIEQHLNTLLNEFTERPNCYELVIKSRLIEMMVSLSRYHA